MKTELSNGGESNGNGNTGDKHGTATRAMETTWVIAMAKRLAGENECKGVGNKGNGNNNEGGR
jgi:hypothetical protein